MTKRETLTIAIETLKNGGIVPDSEITITCPAKLYEVDCKDLTIGVLIEELEAILKECDKKSTAPKKPTKKQLEGVKVTEDIYTYMVETGGSFTTADLVEKFGGTTSYISARVKPLVDTGKVEKGTTKGKDRKVIYTPIVVEDGNTEHLSEEATV